MEKIKKNKTPTPPMKLVSVSIFMIIKEEYFLKRYRAERLLKLIAINIGYIPVDWTGDLTIHGTNGKGAPVFRIAPR